MRAASLAVIAFLAVACGHARIPDQVIEADPAKLDPAAVAQLDAARAEIGAAHGELARASERIAAAREEHALVETDRKAAEAEEERVKKLGEVAKARKRAADARHEYAEKLVEAREAAEQAARCKADLAEAKLELSKYDALERASPAAVAEWKKSDFLDRVAECQRDLDHANEKAAKLDEEASRDRQRWEALSAKLPPPQE